MVKPSNCIQVQPCNCPQIYWYGAFSPGTNVLTKGIYYDTLPIWEQSFGGSGITGFECDRIGGNLYAIRDNGFFAGGTIYLVDFDGSATAVATYPNHVGLIGNYLRVCNAQGNVLMFLSDSRSPASVNFPVNGLWRMNLDGSGLALLCDLKAAATAAGITGLNTGSFVGIAQHADTGDIYTTATVNVSGTNKPSLLKISADGSTLTLLSTAYTNARSYGCGGLDLDYVNSKLWVVPTGGSPLQTSNFDGSALTTVPVSFGAGINSFQVDNLANKVYYFLGVDEFWVVNTDGTLNVKLSPGFTSGGWGRLSEDFQTDGHYGTS